MTIPCYPCRDSRKKQEQTKPKMHTGCCIFALFQHQTSPGSGSSFPTNPAARGTGAAQCWCQEHAKPSFKRGKNSSSSSCDPLKHQCQLSEGQLRHSCFASSHGHGFSNVLFAPPVQPGFAALWGLGCQDISLGDNENICCFSSTTHSNNRHGEKQNTRVQSSRSCLSHGSEGFCSSSSLRRVLSAQSHPWQPRAASASPAGPI